jgi:hypothetical protein
MRLRSRRRKVPVLERRYDPLVTLWQRVTAYVRRVILRWTSMHD